MEIDVIFTADDICRADLRQKTVVVIDVLRATSTMVTALAHGAREIIPCLSPEDAFNLLACAGEKQCLLGGERKSQIISGFHLGKSLIITTTNGTKTLMNAAGAERVLVGSLLNSGALAQKLAGPNQDILLACAGTAGRFSYDDILAAGCIIQKVCGYDPGTALSDSALMARDLYLKHRDNLTEGLLQARHGKRLLALGLRKDIEYCAREDLFTIVPSLHQGRIK